MNNRRTLLIAAMVGILAAAGVAWATAPGIINQYNAVCDPNFTTRCIAPDSYGNVPITVAPSTGGGIAPIVSAAAESNHVFKTSAGNLYGLSVTIGATSGYVLLFDATSLPANGVVTPISCYPITSNGTNGLLAVSWGSIPAAFAIGLVAGFSTTGCFTLTASATATFSAQVK